MTLYAASTAGDALGAEERLAALVGLADAARELIDAVVLTDVDEGTVRSVTGDVAALTERLRAAVRTSPQPLEIGPDGELRHLGNAVAGLANPLAPPLVLETTPDGAVRAEIVFRPSHEGPPSAVHGGISAMILDHLLGHAAAVGGSPGMTGKLTVKYRRPVPYDVPLVAEAKLTRSEGRKGWAGGHIADLDGRPLVQGEGLFIIPNSWPADPP